MIYQLTPPRRRTGSWIAAAVALAAWATASPAEPTQPGRACGDPDDPGTGLLFTEIDGRTVEFPLKHTRVHADVAGAVARVRVTQTFGNPYEDTIEAVYVFPLPHEAAVSDYVMTLGDREIQGVIQRREIARQMYENARRSGHVAALLEQERPNIFTQSVANILPGNEIEVTLTYVETLDYEAGTWELVFPTVVGPRFNPPASRPDVISAGFDERLLPFFGGGEKRSSRDAVENPPYLAPGVRSGHDLEIEVDWDAGIPIEQLTSPTHRIDRLADGETHRRIRLHALDSIPNKDFVLRARA
ncbi:MAG: trypsin, partial [Gemmatimonadetes bacterium]|nr:trypsin [Gemmatimonadota bacterium]